MYRSFNQATDGVFRTFTHLLPERGRRRRKDTRKEGKRGAWSLHRGLRVSGLEWRWWWNVRAVWLDRLEMCGIV